MRNILPVLLSLALLPACVYAQSVVPLSKYAGNLKKLQVSSGGKDYQFLFDSGGGETVISPAVAAGLNKEVYGRVVGYRMNGEPVEYRRADGVDIRIGEALIHHASVGVFDLASLLPAGMPRVDGAVSLKSFRDNIISLDLAGGKLVIETARSAKKKKKAMTQVESRFATGPGGSELNVFLGTKRGGRLYWFLLDSSNLEPLLVSPQTAYEWGLQADNTSTGTVHNAEVSFAGRAEPVAALTKRIIYDGALNYGYIAGKVLLIDFPNKQVWLN